MPTWWSRLGARLIRASLLADRAYLLFDRVRARVVLRLASDAVVEVYNDLAYGQSGAYRADSSTFRRGLFRWEEEAVRCFFPSPPARILIGAAGGGREAFALAEMGYEVVAFEASAPLAETLVGAIGEGVRVTAFRARYEDLPRLKPARAGLPGDDLTRLPPFDAAILGWTSLSHVLSAERRVATLKLLAPIVRGPVLVSAFPIPATSSSRDPAAPAFAPHVGVYQPMTTETLASTAAAAGFRILHVDAGTRDGAWLHAVITAR